MAPNFSKLVSKFWKLVSERMFANFPEICANFPKICINFPKICTNFPKICTNVLNRFLKNIVTRFLNNFRIYGTPTSPGVYNDTNLRGFPSMNVKRSDPQRD